MATRSRQIFVGDVTGPGSTLLYETPPERVTLVKMATAQARSGAITSAEVYVTSAAGPAGTLFFLKDLTEFTAYSSTLWHCLEPGDRLEIYVSAGTLRLFVSGAELVGAP